MYSGKTSALISACRRHLSIDRKILVINYAGDNRYSDFSEIVSHNQDKISCVKVNKLADINVDQILNAESIMIDEGQFFLDLSEYVTKWCDVYKKKIYISALDGDYKRKPFGELLDLIPYSDTINYLKATCDCSKPAIFSKRVVKDDKQILVGANEYKPVCRKCYKSEK
jgi:thymidine kinase